MLLTAAVLVLTLASVPSVDAQSYSYRSYRRYRSSAEISRYNTYTGGKECVSNCKKKMSAGVTAILVVVCVVGMLAVCAYYIAKQNAADQNEPENETAETGPPPFAQLVETSTMGVVGGQTHTGSAGSSSPVRKTIELVLGRETTDTPWGLALQGTTDGPKVISQIWPATPAEGTLLKGDVVISIQLYHPTSTNTRTGLTVVVLIETIWGLIHPVRFLRLIPLNTFNSIKYQEYESKACMHKQLLFGKQPHVWRWRRCAQIQHSYEASALLGSKGMGNDTRRTFLSSVSLNVTGDTLRHESLKVS